MRIRVKQGFCVYWKGKIELSYYVKRILYFDCNFFARHLIERAKLIFSSSCITCRDRYFCPAEWTIRLLEFGLNPFHDTVIVEDVLARCLSNHGRCLEVFHTDGARLLILLELRLREFLAWEYLSKQCQLLLVLLLKHSLGSNRIVHSIHDQVRIVDCIVSLGPILAEDTETSAAAQATEAKCNQHSQHKHIQRLTLFFNAQESKLLLFISA